MKYRFTARFPEQVPEGEIHPGNDINDNALAAIVEGAVIELVPNDLDIGDGAPFDEACEVLLDDVGADIATSGHPKSHGAVAGLHLHHERPQHVDPETTPTLAILRVLAHGCRDVIIDPMIAVVIMVIGAAAPNRKR